MNDERICYMPLKIYVEIGSTVTPYIGRNFTRNPYVSIPRSRGNLDFFVTLKDI